jgi:hypothetical protein
LKIFLSGFYRYLCGKEKGASLYDGKLHGETDACEGKFSEDTLPADATSDTIAGSYMETKCEKR